MLLFELLMGAPQSVAGSAGTSAPGSYPFVIPVYSTLSVAVGGAGGGGGGVLGHGSGGGTSSFAGAVVAAGGGGGGPESYAPADGGAGGASGGSINAAGGGPAGGVGSISTYYDKYGTYTGNAGNGGAGGAATRTYAPGELTPGATVTFVVGAAGGPGFVAGETRAPTAGATGYVWISWT